MKTKHLVLHAGEKKQGIEHFPLRGRPSFSQNSPPLCPVAAPCQRSRFASIFRKKRLNRSDSYRTNCYMKFFFHSFSPSGRLFFSFYIPSEPQKSPLDFAKIFLLSRFRFSKAMQVDSLLRSAGHRGILVSRHHNFGRSPFS